MHNDVAIVILAAGLGTRMKSKKAKVLHQAAGKTLIELVTSTAVGVVPASRIFIVVGHQADLVREALGEWPVTFITQDRQLGTGHAVVVGRDVLEHAAARLVVLYGDCPLVTRDTLNGLLARHNESGAVATVLTTRIENPTGYGRIVRDAFRTITAIVEEKAASPEEKAIKEINSGIYCFETAPLFECLARVSPDNPASEYYLTDVIACLVERGLPVGGFSIPEASQVLGINTRADLAEADAVLRARKARELMLSGVTIQRPETVTLDLDITVGAETVLEPFVQVLGTSSIGAACRIRSYSILNDSTLEDEVTVEPFSLVNRSRVGRGAHIGPYARLREDNDVGPEARIGNFVELKNTRLGRRSRAMHLAYLGDSTIGEDVNIGAGAITCNFDGVRKHPTVIEDGAFVGSNSTLVAPLKIGPGAYVAAGSVVTDDVPGDALAIARSQQATKPGWAAERRRKVMP